MDSRLKTPWSALESITGLVALPAVWRRRLSPDYETFKTLCLQTSSLVARSSPCTLAPACAHRLIANPDGSAAGICRADPPVCPQITFTPEEITPLELSWSKLGRAIAKAFELNSELVDLPVPMTRQVGAWSADAVPVILTIQTEPYHFLFAVGQLAARLRQKFILHTPTIRLVDVRSKEILANHGAELFALDATVIPTPQGTLLPVRSAGSRDVRMRGTTPFRANLWSDRSSGYFEGVDRVALRSFLGVALTGATPVGLS